MAGRLQGKVALVTSAAQGIGRSSALAMANEGAEVWATDIRADLLELLAQEHANIRPMVVDVLKTDQIAAAAGSLDKLDILFNCAGFVHHGTIMDVDDAAWDFSFNLNVRSHFHMIKAFMPLFLQQAKASIINMSSIASSIKGAPNRFVYGASKAAVIGLTKSIAADYVTKGIRVNAICPGTVDTPSLHDRMRAQGDYDKARAAFIARQPMGRLAQPEEIAALVTYLASDESAFTTGQTFVVDGGWSI